MLVDLTVILPQIMNKNIAVKNMQKREQMNKKEISAQLKITKHKIKIKKKLK